MTEKNNKSDVDLGSESITYIQTGKSVGTEPARNVELQKIDRGEAMQETVRNEELQKIEAEFQEIAPSLGIAYFENFEEPDKFRSITAEIEGKVMLFTKISKIALLITYGLPLMLEGGVYILAILDFLFPFGFEHLPDGVINVVGVISIVSRFIALLFSIMAYMTRKTRDTKEMLFINIMILIGDLICIAMRYRLLSIFVFWIQENFY